MPLVGTVHFQTSSRYVKIRLSILEQETVVASAIGQGHVVIPVASFLPNEEKEEEEEEEEEPIGLGLFEGVFGCFSLRGGVTRDGFYGGSNLYLFVQLPLMIF